MSTKTHIRIGTRGSDLALWQAHFVKGQLEALDCEVTLKIIVTQGDRIQDLSFDKLEGKGFFTKEIEQALLNGEVDLAVHSHKDLETTQPEGLHIAAVSYREDASELLLMRRSATDSNEPWNLKKRNKSLKPAPDSSKQLQGWPARSRHRTPSPRAAFDRGLRASGTSLPRHRRRRLPAPARPIRC